MSELDTRCLAAFPAWLRSLADDARAVGRVVDDSSTPEEARIALGAALSYLLKSVDLIADGIEDLGYMDDAFVLRVAAAAGPLPAAAEASGDLERLGNDADLIREFLGSDYERMQRYVAGLADIAVRGRTALDIAREPDARAELLSDIAAWAGSYQAPSFGHDEKNLVKLRSFLRTKLPA